MKKSTDLKRQVFNKEKFKETINTEFNQLVSQPDPSFFDLNLATIKDFWLLYDKFFYDIPKLGDFESHEYLSKTSGEYADVSNVAAEIQALLDEIASLREENLDLRQEQVDNIVENITQE
tara:strand:- start:4879 stop:5238 length:360 start_codon:yes stop_codon:yes gene_type:complete